MGYFSNGTEGNCYEAEHCASCQHAADPDQGCPVMLAHILHAYHECGKGSAAEEILNIFIPRAKPYGNAKCAMHLPIAPMVPSLSDARKKREDGK